MDRLMMMKLTKYIELYANANGAVRNLKNPLLDEGFRMKRFVNDGCAGRDVDTNWLIWVAVVAFVGHAHCDAVNMSDI